MKHCTIKQPAGIGDIFFCQKIATKMRNKGYEIAWPVVDEFLWIKDYISDVNFCSLKDNFPLKEDWDRCYGKTHVAKGDNILLNLQGADALWNNMSVMEAKYKMLDLSFDDWSKYFALKRNAEKEQSLMKTVNPTDDAFVLVSRYYGSPPDSKECVYLKDFKSNLKIIDLCMVGGYTLIDWLGVIEAAQEIHAAESSLNYLVEISNTTNNLHMYSKWSPPSYFHVHNLFKKPWIYH